MAKGHLHERNHNVFSLVIELGKDPLTGKRRQKWVTFYGTKREAEKKLAELVADANKGQIAPPAKMTVGEWLERWHKDHSVNLATTTANRYNLIIQYYLIPHIGMIKLDKLSPLHIAAVYSKLRDTATGNHTGKKLSATTIQHAHSLLHTALQAAVRYKLITDNPASRVEKPRRERKEMQYYSVEEVNKLLLACKDNPRWYAFFLLAITTGMRLGELSALTWDDIDYMSQTISISKSTSRQSHVGIVTSGGKTASSRRVVAVSTVVITALKSHKAKQNHDRLGCAEWQDNNLVFPGSHGQALNPCIAKKAHIRYCKRAGIPCIRLHDLRHTAATLALEAGIHPKVVSERLGHANTTITLNIYSHVAEAMQQQAAQAIETLLVR